MVDQQWTNYTVQHPKRKRRAEAACEHCHTKKVKCDLQTRQVGGHEKCSVCQTIGTECQLRSSRRDRRRQIVNGSQEEELESNGAAREQSGDRHNSHHGQRFTAEERQSNHFDDVGSSQRHAAIAALPPTVFELPHVPPTTSQSVQLGSAFGGPTFSPPRLDQPTSASERSEMRNMSGYVVDTGFLNVYARENEDDANRQAALIATPVTKSSVRADLLQSFAETYFEYCYPWCPIIDKSDLSLQLDRSPLLADALALVGSHIRPPIFTNTTPEQYYNRARRRFYDDEEPEVLVSLRAVLLFYWWSPRAPTAVHRHASWWWTSVVIRHAQQMGIHRESTAIDAEAGMRKRVWWTAFCRERLTAVCQGKPCIIDLDDCSIDEPYLDDFPPDCDSMKVGIFISWVKLCRIIGDVAKYLSQSTSHNSAHPGKQLADWINTLPEELHLSIGEERSEGFNRDIHQLHLPYLAVVVVLHLKRSENSLPAISPTAMMAATCIARIYRDILIRGSTRFLMPINCWYCATAFFVLSQASNQSNIKDHAQEELDILHATIKELRKMWGTADIFERGFQRLRTNTTHLLQNHHLNVHQNNAGESDMSWLDYFPFATIMTSPIAKALLEDQDNTQYLFADFSEDFLNLQYPDLLESFDHVDMHPLF